MTAASTIGAGDEVEPQRMQISAADEARTVLVGHIGGKDEIAALKPAVEMCRNDEAPKQ